MKFKIQVQSIGDIVEHRPHWEEYDEEEVKSIAGANSWAHNIVAEFNKFLRPGELPRKVLSVKMM